MERATTQRLAGLPVALLLVACNPFANRDGETAGSGASADMGLDGGSDAEPITVATPKPDASATPIMPGTPTPIASDAGSDAAGVGSDDAGAEEDDAAGAPVDAGGSDDAATAVVGDICAYALAHAIDERSTTAMAFMTGPTDPTDTTTLVFSPPAVLVYQDQDVNVEIGGNTTATLSIFTLPGDIPPPGTLNNETESPEPHGTIFTTDADPDTYCIRLQITRSPAPPVNGAVIFQKH